MAIKKISSNIHAKSLQQEVRALISVRGFDTGTEHQFSLTTATGKEDWAQGRGWTKDLVVPPSAQTKIVKCLEGSYIEHVTVRRHKGSFRWRLWRLPPGRTLLPHSDGPGQRIHIPVFTNPRCWLSEWDSPIAEAGTSTHSVTFVHLEVGSAYLLDAEQYHSAANHGTTDRWHLIGCVA